MTNNAALVLPTLLLAAFLPIGCNDGGVKLVPVSGTITIDGEPLADAQITVVCKDSRPAYGRSDASGRFSLTTQKPDDGCALGDHKVLVVATEMLPGGKMAYNVPLKYSEILETTATLRVEGKTQDAKIELTWGGQKGPIVVSTNE